MTMDKGTKMSTLGFKPTWNKEGDHLDKEIKFHLTNGKLGWYSYYVDTLMENAEDYLLGRQLCTHGGDNTVIRNMDEFVRFVLEHRWEIENELREVNKNE